MFNVVLCGMMCIVRCVSFVVCCQLSVVGCLLSDVCNLQVCLAACLLVCCLLRLIGCLLSAVCWLLAVGWYLVADVWCLVPAADTLRLLPGACCLLPVVWNEHTSL